MGSIQKNSSFTLHTELNGEAIMLKADILEASHELYFGERGGHRTYYLNCNMIYAKVNGPLSMGCTLLLLFANIILLVGKGSLPKISFCTKIPIRKYVDFF